MGPPTTPGPRTPHHLNPALSEVLNPVQYLFQAFNSLYAALLAAVSYISKPELLWVCSWCWRLSKLKWNRSARSKSTWAKSFLMLLYYRKQINTKQWETQLLRMCADRRALANFFLWPPLTPKYRIAVAVKWW